MTGVGACLGDAQALHEVELWVSRGCNVDVTWIYRASATPRSHPVAQGLLPGAIDAGSLGSITASHASDELTRSSRALAICGSTVAEYGGVDRCVASIAAGASVSPAHDRRAREILLHACEQLTRQFPTTLAEDEALLEQLLCANPELRTRDHRLRRYAATLRRDVTPRRCVSPGVLTPTRPDLSTVDDSDQLADHRRLQCVRSRLSRKRCLDAYLEANR